MKNKLLVLLTIIFPIITFSKEGEANKPEVSKPQKETLFEKLSSKGLSETRAVGPSDRTGGGGKTVKVEK
jgi:hypothetical protein